MGTGHEVVLFYGESEDDLRRTHAATAMTLLNGREGPEPHHASRGRGVARDRNAGLTQDPPSVRALHMLAASRT